MNKWERLIQRDWEGNGVTARVSEEKNEGRTTFFVAILVIRGKNVFCRELANTRPTKELKAFFVLAESLPTPAKLSSRQH